MANGQLLAELTYDNAEYRDAVNHLTFSPDGAFLAASATGGAWGAHGGSLHVWSALDGELVQSLEIAPSGLNGDVAFSPDGTVLAASGGFIPESGEEVLKLWSMPDGQLLHEINYRGVLGDIRFSPDGQQIAVKALNSEQGISLVRMYNVRSGEMMRAFNSTAENGAISIVGYTLDGSLLITNDRGVINFRDISSGEVAHRIEDSRSTPILSPDGELLVAAFDGLQFWGVTNQVVPSLETDSSVADQPDDEDSANDSEEGGGAGADNGDPLSTPEQDFPSQALQNVLQPVDGVVGVVVYDLANNQTLYTQNEDRVFSAASLIKLPIAFTAYALADRGELSLDERLTITAEDIVGGTGSIQYEPVGSTYTIRELCARMLYDSDNTAANVVLERIGGFERVNSLLTDLSVTQTKAQRFLMDFEALQAGRDNLTSPADMARMLQLLAQNEIAGADELLAALTQTNDLQKIPALLPSDVVVSNKTGVLPAPNGVEHDAAVVTLPDERQYILVLMTDELSNNQVAIAAMAEASQIVYEHFQGDKQGTE
jgi:beta-lactamase class A